VPRFESLIEAIKCARRDVESGKYRLRDLVLVSVLVFTGCCLGEALKLKASDLDPRSKTVRIMQEKKRANYPRIVPMLAPLFWGIMERYLRKLGYTEGIMCWHILGHKCSARIIRSLFSKGWESWPWARSISYGLMLLGLMQEGNTYQIELQNRNGKL